MTILTLFLVLFVGRIKAFAQQSYGSSASPSTFHYHGCAVVDLEQFSAPITFSRGHLTHDSCQAECEGQQVAALFPDSCRCGNDSGAFSPLDSKACDYPCMGNPAQGMCGSLCPEKGPGISNIYITSDVRISEDEDDLPLSPISTPSVLVGTSLPSDVPDSSVILLPSSQPPSLPNSALADPSTGFSENTIPPPSVAETAPTSINGDPKINLIPSTTNPAATGVLVRPSSSSAIERDDDPPVPSQIPASGAGFIRFYRCPFLGGLMFIVAVVA